MGSHSEDVSPYGVVETFSNGEEWTATKVQDRWVVVRGAYQIFYHSCWDGCTLGYRSGVNPEASPGNDPAYLERMGVGEAMIGFRCVWKE